MKKDGNTGEKPFDCQRRNSRLHDNQSIYVTLKQWRILHAVIDFGGVSEAATHLHLSQSAVSYTIGKMQEQLGVQLLQIVGRRARLTEAGKEVLDRSRHILQKAIELEMLARQFVEGRKPVIAVAVDSTFPSHMLMRALNAYSQHNPDISVTLSEIGGRSGDKSFDDLSVDLAISPSAPAGLIAEPLVDVEYVAVAHPSHPLTRCSANAGHADLERWVRIGSGPPMSKPERPAKLGLVSHWSVNDLNLVIEAVCEGLGYAWLPRHQIEKYVERGALAPILMGDRSSFTRSLYLLYRRTPPADSPIGKLAEFLREEASRASRGTQQGMESAAPDGSTKLHNANIFVANRLHPLRSMPLSANSLNGATHVTKR